MTIKDRICEEGKKLAASDPSHLALKYAREWWAAGGFSRYSNEDTGVLQSLLSANNPPAKS